VSAGLKEKQMIRFVSARTSACAALACVLGVALAPQAAQAKGHDSNTLHKLGKAIEYPVRKTSENASVAAHRATGSKSVVHRRNGNRTYRSVVTANGRIHRKYRVGHRRRYR